MQQHIETSDIVLAATLKVKGYWLDRIEKDGKRGIFWFTNVAESELREFGLGQSLVEPVALNNAIKALTAATKRVL